MVDVHSVEVFFDVALVSCNIGQRVLPMYVLHTWHMLNSKSSRLPFPHLFVQLDFLLLISFSPQLRRRNLATSLQASHASRESIRRTRDHEPDRLVSQRKRPFRMSLRLQELV